MFEPPKEFKTTFQKMNIFQLIVSILRLWTINMHYSVEYETMTWITKEITTSFMNGALRLSRLRCVSRWTPSISFQLYWHLKKCNHRIFFISRYKIMKTNFDVFRKKSCLFDHKMLGDAFFTHSEHKQNVP